MTRDARIFFPEPLYQQLTAHLLRNDMQEHAAVVGAGLAMTPQGPRLLARELWPAREPQDYCLSPSGYMGIQAPFIHRRITHCRDQRLVYLAIHNHGGSGAVAFSRVDFESHQKGYGALLDIAEGMPVGALVIADGALEADLWKPDQSRSALEIATVLGRNIERMYPNARVRAMHMASPSLDQDYFSRQVMLFGASGQALFRKSKVGIIGLGGVGSLLTEYLARLGVGTLVLIDPDRIEPSNFSRVVGARTEDLNTAAGVMKVAIAARLAREAMPTINIEAIEDDFARESVARRVLDCDYLFLAADSMRARLVFNAIVQQYFIPGTQLGTKIVADPMSGAIQTAFSVVRHVRPGQGCLLCNQLIDPTKLAEEWKTEEEAVDQQYGIKVANPSVITMNAVAASQGVNDFLLNYTGLGRDADVPLYKRFDHLSGKTILEHPRNDDHCPECSGASGSRFGMGDAAQLPCTL